MKNAAEIRSTLEALRRQVAPTLREIEALTRELAEAESREWIAANGIRRKDVQMSHADDLPTFGVVWTFVEWMRDTGCTKRWAEWNGRIYSTAELLCHHMNPRAPGCVEHLPD